MHLVFLNQYYPPDAAPTGVMLEAVVERLAEQGHDVTVVCAQGGYAGGARKEVVGGPLSVVREECSGASATSASSSVSQPLHHQPSTLNSQLSPSLHIVRLGASRFGRGSFFGKLADYTSFYLGAAWKLLLLHPRPDRIIALTTPPYLSVMARLVSKLRGADHAHWVMDLYPDVMVAHGMLAEGGWKHRLLAALARWGFGGSRCAAILTLGPDMAERVGRLNIEHRKSNIGHRNAEDYNGGIATVASSIVSQLSSIQWVPLWGESAGPDCQAHPLFNTISGPLSVVGSCGASAIVASSFDSQPQTPHSQLSPTLRAKRGWRDDELVVMYSGNMGLGHRFGEFLAAAREKSSQLSEISRQEDHQPSTPNSQFSPNFRFVFYGAGKRKKEIEAFMLAHPECRIELHDYAPAEELAEHLRSADVHLASLDAAWTGTMVPSKLQGIFAVGKPVIFVGSPESSIGRWVAESGGGWRVEPDDVDGLLAALDEAGNPEVRMKRGNAAGKFAKNHFDKNTNAARVAKSFTR